MAKEPSRPGIYRLKDGGYYVRARVTLRSGQTRDFQKVVRGTVEEAQRVKDEVRARAHGRSRKRLFAEFAASLLEKKVAKGDLKSSKTIEKWQGVLVHLIDEFGLTSCHDMRYADVDEWKAKLGKRIATRDLSPRTANGWISVLRVITNAMTIELDLPRDPCRGITDFDTADRPAYTEEQPNALLPNMCAKFLAKMKALYPQHYAFVLLGFATGLRPSQIRPLRKDEDVLWKEGAILIRRSNPMKQSIMDKTKTGKRQKIFLPRTVMAVLRAQASDNPLLFPSRNGGFRSRSCLDKPFAKVCEKAKIKIRLTPRGMRRTFQDLARAAQVHDVVTRSISGHSTEEMQRHYSTASQDEQREGIGRIADLLVTGGRNGGTRRRRAAE